MSVERSVDPELVFALRRAMTIELSTIPAYLYARWSLVPASEGGSPAASVATELIRSIIFEEMLHFALAANILNAIGGTPDIPGGVPVYPGSLPGHNPEYAFTVSLGPISQPTLGVFLDIELPRSDEPGPPAINNWNTIGQFYLGVAGLLAKHPETQYGHGRQMTMESNPGAGKLIQVDSLPSALHAIDIIIREGEGLSADKKGDGYHERAHYWKFKSIQDMLSDGRLLPTDVYPLVVSPDAASYTPAQQAANKAFNVVYSQLLDALQATFSTERPQIFGASTGLMDRLGHLAAVLRNTDPGATLAGPTFEYLPAGQR